MRLIKNDKELSVVARTLLTEIIDSLKQGKCLVFTPDNIQLPTDKEVKRKNSFKFKGQIQNIEIQECFRLLGVILYHLVKGRSEYNHEAYLVDETDAYLKLSFKHELWTVITSMLRCEIKSIEQAEKILADMKKKKAKPDLQKSAKEKATTIIEVPENGKALFDQSPRRIPIGLSAKVVDASREHYLDRPELSETSRYAERIIRLHHGLDRNTRITATQFKEKTERLLDQIRKTPSIVSIANGIWLPVILPQIYSDDLGIILDQYLNGLEWSYVNTFSDRSLIMDDEEDEADDDDVLAGEVGIVENSRYGQLLSLMYQGPVMGIYFPNLLQGFSINAQREQMTALPKGFILSGLDTVIAMIMYPDILARDWHTPSLDFSALFLSGDVSDDYSFRLEPNDHGLEFNRIVNLPHGYGAHSGGLFFCDKL